MALGALALWRTRPNRPTTALALATAGVAPPTMTVYKSPTCECCKKWIAKLRTEGFTLDVVETPDIARLLTERPDVIGIAAPGMPTGTPGMDGPKVPCTVVSFDRHGTLTTFAER